MAQTISDIEKCVDNTVEVFEATEVLLQEIRSKLCKFVQPEIKKSSFKLQFLPEKTKHGVNNILYKPSEVKTNPKSFEIDDDEKDELNNLDNLKKIVRPSKKLVQSNISSIKNKTEVKENVLPEF